MGDAGSRQAEGKKGDGQSVILLDHTVCPKPTPPRTSACANTIFADATGYDELIQEGSRPFSNVWCPYEKKEIWTQR